MQTKQIAYLSIAFVAMFFGSVIYFTSRAPSLLMFHWAAWFGAGSIITTLRGHSKTIIGFSPNWLIFSAPFALWVLSYLMCIKAVWLNSKRWERYFWFWSVPIGSLAIEFGQKTPYIPGTYDMVDVITIVVATLIALIIQ